MMDLCTLLIFPLLLQIPLVNFQYYFGHCSYISFNYFSDEICSKFTQFKQNVCILFGGMLCMIGCIILELEDCKYNF
jgi:hypothetical protein